MLRGNGGMRQPPGTAVTAHYSNFTNIYEFFLKIIHEIEVQDMVGNDLKWYLKKVQGKPFNLSNIQ